MNRTRMPWLNTTVSTTTAVITATRRDVRACLWRSFTDLDIRPRLSLAAGSRMAVSPATVSASGPRSPGARHRA